jgi:carbon storage regulator
MLVLTRKRMEQIRIGSGIRITVLKLERNQVRLGIEAPTEMSILRSELIQADETTQAEADEETLPITPTAEGQW